MSNARSPREVCSTTIGTRGLIWRGVYRSPLPVPGRPKAGPLALGSLLLLGRPQPLAGLCLLERDRLRRPRDHVGGLAETDLRAKQRIPPALAQTLEQSLGRLVSLAGAEGGQELLVGDLDPLRVGDRREGGLPPQRALGVALQVGDQLLTRLSLHLRVGLGVDPPGAQRALDAVPHLVGAGVDQL